MSIEPEFQGFLFGHCDVVTSIVVGYPQGGDLEDPIVVSGSRDKTLIIWDLTLKNQNYVWEKTFGEPHKCLIGHHHFVTDLSITRDNVHILSSSWDGTLRLWDMRHGKCIKKFLNPQEKELETVTFSADDCKIFSGGHSKNLSLWNVKGQLKANSAVDNDHREWVTKARYSQSQKKDYLATVGRDGRLKFWFWSTMKCFASIKAHENYINALALSPNGQYIATGGKDRQVKVWDYNDLSKPYAVYKTESEVNSLAFSPHHRLVAAATDNGVRVWNIKSKSCHPLYSFELERVGVQRRGRRDWESKYEDKQRPYVKSSVVRVRNCSLWRYYGCCCWRDKILKIRATAIAWSSTFKRLYVGGSDGAIRVYNITLTSN